MSKPPDNAVKLSETLSMCEYKSGGHMGFWLYDKTRGMNLSMRAKNETDAFVEALHYYQKRLTNIEQEHAALKTKVDAFVSQFVEDDSEA
jgi:hypothetical protein